MEVKTTGKKSKDTGSKTHAKNNGANGLNESKRKKISKKYKERGDSSIVDEEKSASRKRKSGESIGKKKVAPASKKFGGGLGRRKDNKSLIFGTEQFGGSELVRSSRVRK